jgi:hypothetical protein
MLTSVAPSTSNINGRIFLYTLPIGPHIRAAPAASLAGKPRLQIGQADVIRPSVAADRGPMACLRWINARHFKHRIRDVWPLDSLARS